MSRIEPDGQTPYLPDMPGEIVIEAAGVAPGIAIGDAFVSDADTLHVPEYLLAEGRLDDEIARLNKAIDKSRRQIKALQRKSRSLPHGAADEISFILEAHLAMLTGSRLIRGAEARIREARINAEAAVNGAIQELVSGFESLADSYLASRVDDVREVGKRVLRNLTKTPRHRFAMLQPGTILISEEVSPADAAMIDPKTVHAFAAEMGGRDGHTAIMARSIGIPAVLGAPSLRKTIRTGDRLIVDGNRGRVIVNPSEATLGEYRRLSERMAREKRELDRLTDLPARTVDGREVTLYANMELPRDAETAINHGAAGVGLFRTEFLFMNRDRPPTEDEQYRSLTAVIKSMEGRPVTVRTLDVGGEKLAYSLGQTQGGSANPALGLRAIRLGLREPKILETQLAAILRASRHGSVRILLPMISSASEVRQVREIMNRVARKLARRGETLPDPLPPVGVMIEVPGAALAADSLAGVSDFFAIGTNDLTMYTLAIDRSDEQVAHLYNPLHPAVLRLIEFSVQAAARANIPVSICGEMAADTRYTALLLGLGVRELSMAANAIPRIKQRIRTLDHRSAASRARMVMETNDTGRITMLLDDLNGVA